MRRTPLRASTRTRDRNAERAEARRPIREAVFDRDHRVCRLTFTPAIWSSFGPCLGYHLTPHHLRKAGQGGTYTMHNLLTLCAAHNEAVERMPRDDMRALGLVVDRRQDIGQAWALLQLAGLVDWWWDGTPADRARPDAIADMWRRP